MNIGNDYVDNNTNSFLMKVFGRMGYQLFISFIMAAIVLLNARPLLYLIFGNGLGAIGFLALTVIAVIFASKMAASHSEHIGWLGLTLFGALYGIIIAPYFLLYSPGAIVAGFAAGSLMFAILFIIGKTTNKDLSGWGSQLSAAMIALIIIEIALMLFHVAVPVMVTALISLVIFTGYTMYDTQTLIQSYENSDQDDINAIANVGAMNLYADLIGLILDLIQIFARASRDN